MPEPAEPAEPADKKDSAPPTALAGGSHEPAGPDPDERTESTPDA